MVLDIDSTFVGPKAGRTTALRKKEMTAAQKFLTNKADIMAHVIGSMFGQVKDIDARIRAFQVHQPLRQLFWEAFKDVNNPDIAARDRFWEACARAVNNPQSMQMPVWKAEKGLLGGIKFFRREICAPSVVLYRPWTGKEADQVIQPLRIDPAVKAAVAAAHARLKEEELPKVVAVAHTM